MVKKNKKVKVGVFGVGRGQWLLESMIMHPDAEIVAICDFSKLRLELCKNKNRNYPHKVTYYEDFDKFINHDMDAVVLANYATEHAPYAIRLLDSGRHVCSEVLACQRLSEAVALVESVERNKKIYTYAENYCYFRGTQEMRSLYRKGVIGEFIYGEGEYVHDCESIWVSITYGEKNHWRNWVPSTYYCTHSIGPILTITGTRPIRITAYETPNINKRKFGCRSADGAVIVCQMSNGAVAKFLPWCNFRRHPDSIWYIVYGEKGVMETNRWDDTFNRINIFLKDDKGTIKKRSYKPKFPFENRINRITVGHGGSDFYVMHYFIETILGRCEHGFVIDVYQALDMTLPGIFGYKSILNGNMPIDIPDFRDKKIRDKYRNDNWCLDPKYAEYPGQPQYSCSTGPVKIPDSLYYKQSQQYKKMMQKIL